MSDDRSASYLSVARDLIGAGDFQAALPALCRALLDNPGTVLAAFNLGVLKTRLSAGSPLKLYQWAHILEPGNPAAANNLADALLAQGRTIEAETVCHTALTYDPFHARLRNARALIRTKQQELEPARADFRRALIADPSYGPAIFSYALSLHGEATAQADTLYRRAFCSGQRLAAIWSNRGALAQEAGHIEDAEKIYRQGLSLFPGNDVLQSNLAATLLDLGQSGQALTEAQEVLKRDGRNRRALWIESWVHLLRRNLSDGFQNYDLPWQMPEPGSPALASAYPLWQGEQLDQGRLLLWCERGIGDEILYAGLFNDVLAAGLRVVVEVDARLIPLFARSWPDIEFIAKGSPPPPDIAAQSSTLRLPMFYRKTADAFPEHQGYLKADPDLVARYREGFSGLQGRSKTGLAWKSGNPRTGFGKSTDLSEWDGLLGREDLACISLQYNQGAETDPRLAPNPGPGIGQDIDALAAQITALDHVISISGVTAHLAGALGVSGQVLLPPAPIWFWFESGEDCPWYPSLTLVRGARAGAIEAIVKNPKLNMSPGF